MLSLKGRVDMMIDLLEKKGAHVHVPRRDRDYAVTAGLRMLVSRHLVDEDAAGFFRIAKGEERVIAYYANSIAHHFAEMPLKSPRRETSSVFGNVF